MRLYVYKQSCIEYWTLITEMIVALKRKMLSWKESSTLNSLHLTLFSV